MEHHANLVPWQILVQEKDGDLEFIPITDDGLLRLDVFEVLLRLQPKLVAFTHVSNTLGTINPVREMVEMAHAAGALVLVDGAQAVPHVPVDVQELGADFYAFSGHKMLAPMGSGALWARRELLEAMPPFLAGGEMIREVHLRRSEWNDIPWKFEAGTPAVGDAIGLGVAAEYLMELGMDAVREHERGLVEYALDVLPARVPEIELYGPLVAGPAGRRRPVQPAGHPPARRGPGAGPVRDRRSRRPPLHDAAPRAPRPRGDGAGLVQRLHDPRRHRRARNRPDRGGQGLPRLIRTTGLQTQAFRRASSGYEGSMIAVRDSVVATIAAVVPGEPALIERARAGDGAAFEALIAPRIDSLYRTAAAIMGNDADARDATQDACVSAWKHLPRLRDLDSFDAWLGKVLVNSCRMLLRRQRRVREIAMPMRLRHRRPARNRTRIR